MPEERFDYTNERQRHERFVGREALLARLDALLVDDSADRWVVVTGGPGMGKSAILSAWLARREAAGAVVPHHFIRRGAYDWDDPAQMVGSLVAQLDERFPGAREPDPGARMHPAARLAQALSRVSERELGPRGERLVVLIDGLDEYDPPAGPPIGMFEDRKRDARAETLTRLCLGPDVDLESAPQRSRPRCTTRFAVRAIRGDDEGRTDGPSSSSCLPGGTSP